MPALTKNFTSEELIRASSSPLSPVAAGHAQAMADLLQRVRDIVGVPLKVTSWYRSEEKNAATPGSADNSQHMDGTAADVVPVLTLVKGAALTQIATKLEAARAAGRLPASSFGQLIYYPFALPGNQGWGHIHISLPTRGKYGQTLVRINESAHNGVKYAVMSPEWLRQFPSLPDIADNAAKLLLFAFIVLGLLFGGKGRSLWT